MKNLDDSGDVHRDLKPGNLVLEAIWEEDSEVEISDRVLLIDVASSVPMGSPEYFYSNKSGM